MSIWVRDLKAAFLQTSRIGLDAWLLSLSAAILLAIVIFIDGAAILWQEWQKAEFSHGLLIPIISGYLLYRLRHQIAERSRTGHWTGLVFIAVSLLLLGLGELSTIYSLIQFGLVVAVIGLFYSYAGHQGMYLAIGPLIHLFLMIPIPDLIYNSVSQQLQLISSGLGVAFIRMLSIPVYLEGNVIDLGVFELQVAEACNGLRYAYPLTSLAYIIAFSYKGPLWHKGAIILAALPMAILMNSLRIAMTGVMVSNFGIEAAEGFLHYFEGWVIFLLCVGMMLGLVALFGMALGPHKSLLDCLDIEPMPEPKGERRRLPAFAPPTRAAALMILIGGLFLAAVPERTEALPDRRPFLSVEPHFPGWAARSVPIEPAIVRQLVLSDYLMLDLVRHDGREAVSLYISYYESQRKGAAVHSPAACMPAGGWEIEELSLMPIEAATRRGGTLLVNRGVIRRSGERQLVYYWFDQRGAELTSAFDVKWRILKDALIRQRTDGSMIRLSTRILPGEDVKTADKRLADLARGVYGTYAGSLPE